MDFLPLLGLGSTIQARIITCCGACFAAGAMNESGCCAADVLGRAALTGAAVEGALGLVSNDKFGVPNPKSAVGACFGGAIRS